MKKSMLSYILLFLSLIFSGCLQPVVPSSQLVYTEIVEHNQKGAESYELSKMWLANIFNDSKAVIEYDNKEKGTVIGKGIFPSVSYGTMVAGKTSFTLEIEVKDNKSRITFSNMVIDPRDPYNSYTSKLQPYNMWNMEQLEYFKIKAKELTQGYSDYINGGTKKADW
jgi:hypothetical protein